MALEITALSGRRYQFVEVEILTHFVSVYAWYSDKWNRLTCTFPNMEDAKSWVAEMNEEYVAWKNAPKINNTLPEGAYASMTGYYGD